LKVLRLLGVPAMVAGMLSLVTATAYANVATITVKLDCTSSTKVCFDLTATTKDFPQGGRDVVVTLMGHEKTAPSGAGFVQIGQSVNLHLTNGLDGAHLAPLCFDNVKTADFDKFELVIAAPAGVHDITINGHSKATFDFANTCPVPSPSPTPSASPSATPTPSPSASAPASPSASPSAATTVVLAQTGGFDFRFPLIGLILLVGGGTLYVVSASRGRSTSNK
jgi:hypothetical protein